MAPALHTSRVDDSGRTVPAATTGTEQTPGIPAGRAATGYTAPVSTLQRAVGVSLAVLGGAMAAGQSRINGELGARLHDGIAAAAISFGGGLVVLAVMMPVLPAGRRGLARVRRALRDGSLHWWECAGGFSGAFLVTTQGATVAPLGVAVFTVAVVAGQSGSSLAVDRAGFGPAGPQPITANRLVGAVLSIAAVFVAVYDRLGSPTALALAALPAVAGISASWQQAVNGRVRMAAGSALPATFVNFLAGCAGLALALAVDLPLRGGSLGSLPREPWLYLGGLIGITFIAIGASVVRHTGVLLLGLGTIAGQLIGALLVDVIVPGPEGRPGVPTLIGIVLTLVAVGIAALPSRR